MFRSPLVLAGSALFLLSLAVGYAQAPSTEFFPGAYPQVQQPEQGTFEFTGDEVRIVLKEGTKSGRVIVFAHSDSGHIVGVLKPIENGVVTLRRGDLADYRLTLRGKEVTGSRLLKAMDRYVEREDMFEHVVRARKEGRPFGLQRCLFPICSRCLDGCRSVIPSGEIPLRMAVGEQGYVGPVFARGTCPRCGKCFTWCPSGVIKRSGS